MFYILDEPKELFTRCSKYSSFHENAAARLPSFTEVQEGLGPSSQGSIFFINTKPHCSLGRNKLSTLGGCPALQQDYIF